MAKGKKKGPAPAADINTEKKAYDDQLAFWRKKRQEFEAKVEEQGAHAVSTMPRLAALSRSGPYRKNGYFYIKGKTGLRAAYDKSLQQLGQNLKSAGKKAQGGVVAGSTQHASLYVYEASRAYPSGKRFNFFASFMPYTNEAHHLVPVEAIAAGFNKSQLALLGKLPFNINHGQNIIFLPKKTKDTPIHGLPQHSGSHPQYNALVKGDLATLRGQLVAKEEEECKPEDPPPIAVLDKLILFEDKYWKFLVKQGAMNINRRAADELAKKQAASSGV